MEETKALISCCILLNSRSQRVSGIQLLLSFMMVARGISKQVNIIVAMCIHILDTMPPQFYFHRQCLYSIMWGMCMSYGSTWGYLKHLTQEANYLQRVYDLEPCGNLNIHQKIPHEREGMYNM